MVTMTKMCRKKPENLLLEIHKDVCARIPSSKIVKFIFQICLTADKHSRRKHLYNTWNNLGTFCIKKESWISLVAPTMKPVGEVYLVRHLLRFFLMARCLCTSSLLSSIVLRRIVSEM